MQVMKKAIAVLTALIMGISCCPPGNVAMAAQNDETAAEIERSQDADGQEAAQNEEDADRNEAADNKEAIDNKESGAEKLQIPQKMTVVIDPWEMDGREQIYSEEYVVRNAGETAGILTMSASICKSSGQSEAVVRQEKEGLHDDETKSVYMEMEFGNGEKIVLSREGCEYQIELEPGGELRIRFQGEVNENAAESWKDGDITVDAVYSWENIENTSSEVQDSVKNNPDTAGEEQPGKAPDGEASDEEETRLIEMREPQELDFSVDSWEIDEKGKIVSEQYTVRNAGEEAGTLVLSDLVCKPGEESGITVLTGKEKLHDGGKTVYIEMAVGEEEKIVLHQEGQEDTGENAGYEVKLSPGEEVTVCFTGEVNEIRAEELAKGELTVTAAVSWILEEPVSE